MRRWTRGVGGPFVLLAVISFAVSGTAAAELRTGELVTVEQAEVIDDDLYVVGRTVNILGTVTGDVVALGGTVTIGGEVRGDVLVAAGTISLLGTVEGSARAIAGEVVDQGVVGEDAAFASGSVRITPQGQVRRNLFLASADARVEGPVSGDLFAAAGELSLASSVGGNASVQVRNVRLLDSAQIAGDFRYSAERAPIRSPSATISGAFERQREFFPTARRMTPVVRWMRLFVGFFGLGLVLALLFPTYTRRTLGVLREAPLKSLGLGTVALIGLPILLTVVVVVGAFVGGWWVGVLGLGAYAIALALCIPVVGVALGQWVLGRLGRRGAPGAVALMLGVAILTLVGQVPLVGGALVLVVLLFGLGAIVAPVRLRDAAVS